MKRSAIISLSLFLLCGAAFYIATAAKNVFDSTASDGVADLQATMLDGHIARVLSGWESYPDKLYEPEDFAAGTVSSSIEWENEYGKGESVGTHRMTLLLPVGETMAIRFRSIDYATKVYIGGELAGEIGTVGATKDSATPRVSDCYFVFTPETSETEIVLQYSNFHHRRGGHPPELIVGTPVELLRMTQKDTLSQVMVAGVLFTAFMYHLVMFLLYGRRRTFLYFALCCLTFAVRALLSLFIAFVPDYNWFIMIRIEYLDMFSGAALLMLFFYSLFPKFLSKHFLFAVAALLAAYNIIVIITSPAFFSQLLIVIQPLCVLAVGYITVKLGLKLKGGGLAVFLAFLGIALFLVTAVNDVLHLNELPNLGANLMPVGIVMFTLVYMMILSMEFAENERRLEAARISEERILAEKNELDVQSRMKTEFVQNMSHELKTPLTVVSNNIQNAADQLDFEMNMDDMRESIKKAQREIMRMARMVDDALEFTTTQENRSQMERLNPAPLLRGGAETYRSILTRHGNALTLEIPESLPNVYGSADKLMQVLLNLLSNADHHTQNGKITVIASEDKGVVSVSVRDNGEGIKPELLPHMFKRGVSVNGTGFGLSISKAVIDAHKGEISIESEYGKGTTVTFTLPEIIEDGES